MRALFIDKLFSGYTCYNNNKVHSNSMKKTTTTTVWKMKKGENLDFQKSS